MVWHTVRYLITFFFPAFYKRIQAKNLDNITKTKGPVIVAMNHPNAFTDPLYITYLSHPLKLRYMARGDAFKPGFAAWFLESLGIVPIFRMQDGGKEGLKKNDEAYRRVNYLLGKNSKIIVFAEGICVQERRLRPVKKGVARMVFGAYEALKSDNLMVIPAGVNYSHPDKFRSNVFYNIGEPIFVKDFIKEYNENPARANKKFLEVLEPKMRDLITHIEEEENDEVVYRVEELCKKNRIKEQGLNYKNLEHDFIVLKQITAEVNAAAKKNRDLLKEFKTLSLVYFSNLKKNNLKDWLIDPKQNKNVTWFNFAVRFILLVLGFPLYLVGLTGNYIPLTLTHKITKKIVKTREFYSSFALGFGMVIFWVNYILWFIAVYSFAPNVFWPFSVCFIFAMCAWFSLNYHPFMLKTFGMLRSLKNKLLIAELAAEREKLLSLINKF